MLVCSCWCCLYLSPFPGASVSLQPVFREPFTSDRKIMTTVVSLRQQQQQQQQQQPMPLLRGGDTPAKGKKRRESRSSSRSSCSSTDSRRCSTAATTNQPAAAAAAATAGDSRGGASSSNARPPVSAEMPEETENQIGVYRVYVKGAAETVLRLCSTFIVAAPLAAAATGRSSSSNSSSSSSKEISPDLCLLPLTRETAAAIEQQVIDLMAGQALRTICVAYKDFVAPRGDTTWKEMSHLPPFKQIETGLTCLAILGIRSALGFRV